MFLGVLFFNTGVMVFADGRLADTRKAGKRMLDWYATIKKEEEWLADPLPPAMGREFFGASPFVLKQLVVVIAQAELTSISRDDGQCHGIKVVQMT